MRLSSPAGPPSDKGSAVIVLLALLSLMVLFVFANLKTLSYLSRELKLVEKRQIERLQKPAGTNALVAAGLQHTNVVPSPQQHQGFSN